MKYLTLFTIGPVQSFIAKARKLQDLYAGSFLLSYLTKKAMEYANEKGSQIIFPDIERDATPNRFLFKIDSENEKSTFSFCSELEDYVKNEWECIAKTVISEIDLKYSNAVEAQIKSLIQVYFAFEPYKDGEDYSECYIRVIKQLSSAKMLRGFSQLDEVCGRKCTLMYEYNALFYRKKLAYLAPDAQIVTTQNISPEDKLNKYIREEDNEALSAPAFIKRCLRFANTDIVFDDNFPSVTDIYELSGDKYSDNDDKHGYYALVMFDGDNMGEWYSKPNIYDKTRTEQFQAYLSKKISEFAANNSRAIVDMKKHRNGVVIYAGGEDFLGALNIKSVFNTLKQLREKFGEINLTEYTDKKLTFSAGVVIAHIKTPLAEVLKMARSAEHEAKSRSDKDAYCLTIAKHSGEVSSVVQPFYRKGKSSLDTIDELVNTIVAKGLSTKFIYQLGIEMEHIRQTGDSYPKKEIFLCEAKRLLEHSEYPDEKKKKQIVTDVYDILCQLIEIETLDTVLSLLRAVVFIARERGAV